ncbi:hypothetical protein EBZ39_04075 [bacterium]|nr:hypothetical protein [bacterium]
MANMAFAPCTGAVEVTRFGCSQEDFLVIKVGGKNFSTEFIVMGVTLEMAGNYQFLHTVNDFVYFYAFGDRVGSLTVTGIGFLKMCSDIVPFKAKEGAKIFEVYKYYNENRSAAKKGEALDIVLTAPSGDPIRLHGFLTGIKIDNAQSDTGPIGHWTMRFEVLPQKQ